MNVSVNVLLSTIQFVIHFTVRMAVNASRVTLRRFESFIQFTRMNLVRLTEAPWAGPLTLRLKPSLNRVQSGFLPTPTIIATRRCNSLLRL